MALAADLIIMLLRRLATGNVMRVVARRALQAAAAHLKTGRPAEPVTLAGDLKFLIGRDAIEVEYKVW